MKLHVQKALMLGKDNNKEEAEKNPTLMKALALRSDPKVVNEYPELKHRS
jgi:hypothetical protein